jgi:AraC-like DNA-binding protein
MQAIPQLRTSVIRPLLDFLDQHGVEPGPLLSGARPLLHDPTALVPITTGGVLFEEAERCSGLPDVGLRAATAVPILEFGDWGSVLAACATLAGFLSALVTVSRRFNSGQRFWAVQRGDETWLHQRFSSQLTLGRRSAAEYALMMILRAMRLATGSDWRPNEIHLEGAPPPHADRLAALASKRICFEQPYTAIVFPTRALACRYPRLVGAPRAAERARVPADSFAGSIRQVVESLVMLGIADLAAAAEATHMSERSLQRHLTECGLSFTQLVDETRFDSACRMLRGSTAKIVEISAELGYTDSANFTRAFRRWAGVSPQTYRRSA